MGSLDVLSPLLSVWLCRSTGAAKSVFWLGLLIWKDKMWFVIFLKWQGLSWCLVTQFCQDHYDMVQCTQCSASWHGTVYTVQYLMTWYSVHSAVPHGRYSVNSAVSAASEPITPVLNIVSLHPSDKVHLLLVMSLMAKNRTCKLAVLKNVLSLRRDCSEKLIDQVWRLNSVVYGRSLAFWVKYSCNSTNAM